MTKCFLEPDDEIIGRLFDVQEDVEVFGVRAPGEVLDRDAIVIGDGGDFVSFAGRVIETYEPGCWMDPGPFGCLGAGPGQAIGAKSAHPDRQVCLLLGDGAFGFAGIEFDTTVFRPATLIETETNNLWTSLLLGLIFIVLLIAGFFFDFFRLGFIGGDKNRLADISQVNRNFLVERRHHLARGQRAGLLAGKVGALL